MRRRLAVQVALACVLAWHVLLPLPAWVSDSPRTVIQAENGLWTVERLREMSLEEGHAKTLKQHGVALLPKLFETTQLTEILQAFLQLQDADDFADFKFGDLRAERQAVHLPFEPPFDGLPLLGKDATLLAALSRYLGQDFVLESALIITVHGGTSTMNAHTDTEDEGSLSVHIPLQPLTSDFAPLSFCPGTQYDIELLDRAGAQARRWRCIGESSADARKRIAAGLEAKRQSLSLHWDGEASALLGDIDLQIGKTCARVRSLRESTTSGLQVGDEITHVNDLRFGAWLRIHPDIAEMSSNLMLRVLRPPHINTLEPPPNLLVGAPLNLGDAIVYDSRTVHWGMANEKSEARHVLYLNFMSANFEGYSPDGDAIEDASSRCLEARAAFRKRLQDIKGKALSR